MAKAHAVLPDGTKVTIEGTDEEVARVLGKVSGTPSSAGASAKSKRESASTPKSGAKAGPMDYVRSLRNEKFFKTRRTLGDIQKKLEEMGHIYAQTSLSPTLVRLVRKRELRRVRGKKGWDYVS